MKRSSFLSFFSAPTRRRPIRSAYVIETLVPRVMLSADNVAAVNAFDSATASAEVAAADSHDYPVDDLSAAELPTTPPEAVASGAGEELPESTAANSFVQPELPPMARGLFDETPSNDLTSLVDVAAEVAIVNDADVPPTTQLSQGSIESTLTLPLISFIAEQVEASETAIESEFSRLDPLEQQQTDESSIDTKPQTEARDSPQPNRQSTTSDSGDESDTQNAIGERTPFNTTHLDELDQVFENSLLQFSLIELPAPPLHAAAM